MKYILSPESAKEELEKLYAVYDFDPSENDSEAEQNLTSRLERSMIKAIRLGRVTFEEHDERGFCVIQKLKNSEQELSYKELDGQAKIQMNKVKDDIMASARCYALLGHLCGQGDSVIRKLKSSDLKTAEAIGAMLLIL